MNRLIVNRYFTLFFVAKKQQVFICLARYVLLLPFCVIPAKLFPSHLMGSDITYRCIGNKKYEVTLTVYRDCKGTVLPATLNMNAVCIESREGVSITVNRIKIKDITGLDPKCNVKTRCSGSGGFPYGVEEHTYKGTVDLSAFDVASCKEVIVSWKESARNNSISTGAAGLDFYTSASIFIDVGTCNSSPVFTTPATALICVGSDFTFNNGAIDTIDNGDSLSYNFALPMRDEGWPINYNGSWGPDRPVTFLGFPNATLPLPYGFHLDQLTGNISFRPTVINEASVMVLEVTEWRKVNGKMRIVGKTRRDMQVIVVNCVGNSPPVITGESKSVCPGTPVCIKITTSDTGNYDSVKLSWNEGIKGATYTGSKGTIKQDTATICWTPTAADIRTVPYIFTVTARDNGCPFAGQSVKAFTIFVDGKPLPSFTVNDTIQCLDSNTFNFTNTSIATNSAFTSRWQLSNGQNSDSLNFDSIHFAQPGKYNAKLVLTSYYGCKDSTSKNVSVYAYPNPGFSLQDYYCTGSPAIYLKPLVTGGIFTGKNVTDTLYNPIFTGNDIVRYTVEQNGCKSDTAIVTMVHPYPFLNLGNDTTLCTNELLMLNAEFPGSTYQWQDGSTSWQYIADKPGVYKVTLFNTCDTLSDFITIKNCLMSHFPNAFSPNGDGINDVFMPVFEGVTEIEFKVYDRWGELIFESNDLNKGWDGRLPGNIHAPTGIYAWTTNMLFYDGLKKTRQLKNGNVTLLR